MESLILPSTISPFCVEMHLLPVHSHSPNTCTWVSYSKLAHTYEWLCVSLQVTGNLSSLDPSNPELHKGGGGFKLVSDTPPQQRPTINFLDTFGCQQSPTVCAEGAHSSTNTHHILWSAVGLEVENNLSLTEGECSPFEFYYCSVNSWLVFADNLLRSMQTAGLSPQSDSNQSNRKEPFCAASYSRLISLKQQAATSTTHFFPPTASKIVAVWSLTVWLGVSIHSILIFHEPWSLTGQRENVSILMLMLGL